jgi:hypothetical protein
MAATSPAMTREQHFFRVIASESECSPDERSDIRGLIALLPRISLRSSGLHVRGYFFA